MGAARPGYRPALDGVRALAVVAVVAFHVQVGPSAGGFLGVSVFFTLSGFLITSLLVAEHGAEGRVDLGTFYARRIRRLLPAAWLTIGLVLAAAPWWSDAQMRRLSGDTVGALANVANWRSATSTASYQELFADAPSPLAHFWSLAIEEQMYLALPVVLVIALRAGRRVAGVVVASLTVASLAAGALTTDFDLAYNGTHVRAAELLVGSLAAIVVASASRPTGPNVADGRVGRAARLAVDVLGTVGLGALGLLVVSLDLTAAWLIPLGLGATAVATVPVLLACWWGGGLATVLAWRPLAALGRVSYGVYLFHWPVVVLFDAERTGLGRWPLLAVRLAVTGALTVASYHLVEQPIRRGRRLVRPAPAAAAALIGATAIVAGALILPDPRPSTTEVLVAAADDDGSIRFDQVDGGGAAASGPRPSPDTSPAPIAGRTERAAAAVAPGPPVVLVAGSDPAALDALDGLDVVVVDAVQAACPVATGAEARLDDGTVLGLDGCESIVERLTRFLAATSPDVVVMSLGPLDQAVIRQSHERTFPTPAEIEEFGAMRAAAEVEIERGVEAILGQPAPVVFAWWGDDGLIQGALERFDVAHDLVQDVTTTPTALRDAVSAAAGPEVFAVVGAGDAMSVPVVDDRIRVLVIGDSTSLHVARALHGASDDVDVLWAGRNGCPLVDAVGVRPRRDDPVRPLDCPPLAERVGSTLDGFDADVVVAVAGPTHLAELQFTAQGEAVPPGSEEWVVRLDGAMAGIVGAVDGRAPILVADSPDVRRGAFASPDMVRPERNAAWNLQIVRWADAHDEVSVLPLRAALEGHEAEHGTIRPDGVHPEIGPLTELLRADVVPSIVAAGS